MGEKTKMFFEALKMFGVNTGGIESIVEKFSVEQPVPVTSNAKTEESYWDGEYGNFFLTDKTGNKLTKETFANVSDFEEGLAVIERQKDKGSRCGFIDPSGKFPFEPIYDSVQIFAGGLAPVELKKKWGFIDKTGKQVIPLKYDEVRRFDMTVKGQAQVREGDKWFYIDREGRFVKDSDKPAGWK